MVAGTPNPFVPELRAVCPALDADLPLHPARLMGAIFDEGRWWFVVWSGTLGGFFVVVLAAVGTYAVVACSVG